MANGGVHFLAGSAFGVSYYALRQKERNEELDFGRVIAVGLLSGFVAVLPDLIDPPTSPRHRSIGHSFVLSGALLPNMWKIVRDNPNISESDKDFYHALLIAFGSHLVLDAGTPAGLPLIQ